MGRMLTRSENLFHRLQARQITIARPGTQVHAVRQLYENIVPSHTAFEVECPDHIIRRFSHDGQYLICFSRNGHELIVYRHQWLSYSTSGEEGDDDLAEGPKGLPDKAKRFDAHFCQVYAANLVRGNEVVCKDFFLCTESSTYGIFVTATPTEGSPTPAPGAIQGVPAMESITFHLIRLADGVTTDKRTYKDDFVNLAHNAGVFLYGDLLSILSIRYQNIYVLQVRETAGLFVDARTIGLHCREDDELVLTSQLEVEARFQRQQEALKKARQAVSRPPIQAPGTSLLEPTPRVRPVGNFQNRLSFTDTSPWGPAFVAQQNSLRDYHAGGHLMGEPVHFGDSRPSSVLPGTHTTAGLSALSRGGVPGDRETSRDIPGFSTYQLYGQQTGNNRVISRSRGSHRSGEGGSMGPPSWSGRASSSTQTLSSRLEGTATVSSTSTRDSSGSSGGGSRGDPRPRGSQQKEPPTPVEYVTSSRANAEEISKQQLSANSAGAGCGPEQVGALSEVAGGATLARAGEPSSHLPPRAHAGLLRPSPSPHSGGSTLSGPGHSLQQGQTSLRPNLHPAPTPDPTGSRPTPSSRANASGTGEARNQQSYPGQRIGAREGRGGTAQGPGAELSTGTIRGSASLGSNINRNTTAIPHGGGGFRATPAADHGRPAAQGTSAHLSNVSEVPAAAEEDGEQSTDAPIQGSPFLSGLKQRLLAFIFRSVWEQEGESPASRGQRVKRFYYHFQHYLDLVMWKVQFLDRQTLLIKLGSVDGVMLRGSDSSHQNAFFAVYDLSSTSMLAFFQNSSEEFLAAYEHFCDHFRVAPQYPVTWAYMSSTANNLFAREQLRKQKLACLASKGGSYAQAVKRTLAMLPFNAQSQNPSAYLDQALFHFDEKLISATDRHKPCMEHPIKFISRRRPNTLKFKINPGLEAGPSDNRVKRVASYLFHPVLPFAISIQQAFLQPPIINLHFRK